MVSRKEIAGGFLMANKCNCKSAGRINGNPLCGLCERVCIQTKKITDGCIARFSNVDFIVGLPPVSAPAPYTFVEMRANGVSTVTNLTVTPLDGARARLNFTATVPVVVLFTDANGVSNSVNSTVSVNRDIVLTVPQDELIPYAIEVSTNLLSRIGSFSGDNSSVSVTACVVQVVRVVRTVEILVPSYGACEYPVCEDYQDECEILFNSPSFPF